MTLVAMVAEKSAKKCCQRPSIWALGLSLRRLSPGYVPDFLQHFLLANSDMSSYVFVALAFSAPAGPCLLSHHFLSL